MGMDMEEVGGNKGQRENELIKFVFDTVSI